MLIFLPSISILIPTLNSARVLKNCLNSIVGQEYPKSKLEIIFADGGSTDGTLGIAKKYGAKIYKNPLKTGEAGKTVALKQAKNELVALIDSDNVLPSKNWLKKMVEPLVDPEIIGSEPIEFTYRKQDGFIDRYCALLGMNDPLCLFFGNYDKKSVLTGKWTELKVQSSKFKVQNGKTKETEDKDWDYLKIEIKPPNIPTIGANGTILRRKILIESNFEGDYLFDIDIITQLASQKPVKFAQVKTGIIHLYCGSDISKFIRKQKRRIKDYLHYQKIGVRSYPWQRQNKRGLFLFIFNCLTIVPLFFQVAKGYFKKADSAWFFHPLACLITFLVYGWGWIKGIFAVNELSRKGWRQ